MQNYYPAIRLIKMSTNPAALENDPIIARGIRVFQHRISRRCGASITKRDAAFELTLSVDPSIGKEGFRITGTEAGAQIAGSDALSVVYGLGKFLHTSGYTAQGFHPSRWQGTSVPTSPFRTIQLDTHFCNAYHTLPAHELTEYVEDLILWGINHIEVVFPLLDLFDWNDPEVGRITGQIRTIYMASRDLGVKFGMEVVPNQDFVNQNMDIQAEPCPDRPGGKTGHNICPNRPGAIEYILTQTNGRIFTHLQENGILLDFICFWPYDEGGCGCEKCTPWGGRGYLMSCKALMEAAKAHNPNMEVILSTWMFDTHWNVASDQETDDEWQGLTDELAKDNSWVDYILADSRTDFPRYPLEKGVPGNLPMINYPEISMYKLHPWGGFGANPLPDHFEKLWHQVMDIVQGGMAYSEGIFNDINKVLVSQFWWDKYTTADATLREYINYEYSPAVYDAVREAICLMERNQEIATDSPPGKQASVRTSIDDARRVCELLRDVDTKLDAWAKKAWRWRILIIRAELDLLRYTCAAEKADTLTPQTFWVHVMKGCEEAKPYFTELTQIFYSNLDYDNTTHPHYCNVRPQLMDI